ncbi:MAG TPA: CAP domain-containing protein, partial [Kineosporiaceae bacterium]|nr:CAP domain-containing protein [Kineosporiaceae bacterium]
TAKASAAAAAKSGLTLGPGTESPVEAQVVTLVNQQRITAGCRALTISPILITVARAHSKEMSDSSGGIKHNSADGRTPFQRMTAAGYSYSVAAENIAAGQSTAAAVMAAWMASEGHRANILNCGLTQIGVGTVYKAGSQYGTYWTQDLAAPM